MKLKILVVLTTLVVLATACAPTMTVEQRHANGRKWQTSQKLQEYHEVDVGSVDIGGIPVPVTEKQWATIQTEFLTGNDDKPIPPNKMKCTSKMPEKPNIGDRYCKNGETTYFLIFGEKEIQVEKHLWEIYNSDVFYSVSIYDNEVISVQPTP